MSTKPTTETSLPTYSEVMGQPQFDWRHALNHPEKYSYERLYYLAKDWVTCACGNQCSIIERDSNGMPLDIKLIQLGRSFFVYIEDGRWDMAHYTLDRIEQRSDELINEILNKHE